MGKYVYSFFEGSKNMRSLLGGKGANLCEMIHLGLPVPRGFIVTTEACNRYYVDKEKLASDIEEEIIKNLGHLELVTNKKINDSKKPLLLSVRSGAVSSMPGMMDTILNVGMNDELARTLIANGMDKRFVYDCYRRLIMMFSDVVKGIDKNLFESFLSDYKISHNLKYDNELSGDDLEIVTNKYLEIYKSHTKKKFPQDIKVQLIDCVGAVFKSWNNKRAKAYRKMNNISDDLGTAVNVQEMVYGNMNELSGTGVAFSRNPVNGKDEIYGEFMLNAQGEDLVSGVRTPQEFKELKKKMPHIYEEFVKYAKILERHYHDMQDMEFTIEDNTLYMLQTRNGKRTSKSAIKIAVDLVKEGLISEEDAILMVDESDIEKMLHKTFKDSDLKKTEVLTSGLPASPGAGVGSICFTKEEVLKRSKNGEKVILVRNETSAEDIEGMAYAEAIVTAQGGATSHAAVVARGMGKCCVCGCKGIVVDEKAKALIIDGKKYKEGTILSIDGTSGNIYSGELETEDAKVSGEFKEFMEMVYKIKKTGVRANAETIAEVKKAISLGADGIGLSRTEHMFFEDNKINHFRKMIVSETRDERVEALKQILKIQKKDFMNILKELNGLPITVRYLDPPLHEFLPKTEKEIKEVASILKVSVKELKSRINELKEFNPMMGNRGCRLLINYPEIIEMQTEAIIGAALEMKKKNIVSNIEIMIPLVSDVKEFVYVKKIIQEKAKELFKVYNYKVNYKIGTMIELPRACIKAHEIAMEADFFSFGTNDLTQMSFGFSRDDASKFLNTYYRENILPKDPFVTLDESGVGELISMAVMKSRCVKNNIKLGVCGEHGGDPDSVKFFHSLDFDYVSCSPYRIPISALTLAKSQINLNNLL